MWPLAVQYRAAKRYRSPCKGQGPRSGWRFQSMGDLETWKIVEKVSRALVPGPQVTSCTCIRDLVPKVKYTPLGGLVGLYGHATHQVFKVCNAKKQELSMNTLREVCAARASTNTMLLAVVALGPVDLELAGPSSPTRTPRSMVPLSPVSTPKPEADSRILAETRPVWLPRKPGKTL